MNLGFYVHSTAGTELNNSIYEFLNSNVDGLRDRNLFYNVVDFNPVNAEFGLYNSTEIWTFRGTLVVTDLHNLAYVRNVTNKIDIIYLHCSNVKPLELLVYANNVRTFSLGGELAAEYKRMTGNDSVRVDNINELWENING